MNHKYRISLLVLAAALLLNAAASADENARPRFGFELEGGPVWQTLNNVEIPNDGTATRFSLADLAGTGPYLSYRLALSYAVNEKHLLLLLLAPFTIEESGIPPLPIRFENREFNAGEPLSATYQFNSYRLSYRYRLYHSENWEWRIGFTGKIRDAKIALAQGDLSASNSNIGFVPLLHLTGSIRISECVSLALDADFLAAPQGRAEDVSLKLHYRFLNSWFAAAGYRMLEGGADVEDVYTFAWLHYAVFSIGRSL